jgi:hypothetical protein
VAASCVGVHDRDQSDAPTDRPAHETSLRPAWKRSNTMPEGSGLHTYCARGPVCAATLVSSSYKVSVGDPMLVQATVTRTRGEMRRGGWWSSPTLCAGSPTVLAIRAPDRQPPGGT